MNIWIVVEEIPRNAPEFSFVMNRHVSELASVHPKIKPINKILTKGSLNMSEKLSPLCTCQ